MPPHSAPEATRGARHEQTAGLERISTTAAQITGITETNASGAAESLGAAKVLEGEVEKLSRVVHAFKF